MQLLSNRLVLASPTLNCVSELFSYTLENRAHLSPWEPARSDDYYSLETVQGRIQQYTEDAKNDKGYFLLIRQAEKKGVIGTIHLSGVVRGPFQSAYLGYGLAKSSLGRGYMTEAVMRVLDWAFGELNLHRVEANIVPENEASRAVLRRCGFKPEGFSPKYLRIQNEWRDHERFATIKSRDCR